MKKTTIMKLLALVLSAMMIISLVACTPEEVDTGDTGNNETEAPTNGNEDPTDPDEDTDP